MPTNQHIARKAEVDGVLIINVAMASGDTDAGERRCTWCRRELQAVVSIQVGWGTPVWDSEGQVKFTVEGINGVEALLHCPDCQQAWRPHEPQPGRSEGRRDDDIDAAAIVRDEEGNISYADAMADMPPEMVELLGRVLSSWDNNPNQGDGSHGGSH